MAGTPRDIPLEPIEHDAFAPFGDLVAAPDTPPVFGGTQLEAWRLPFEVDDAAALMVVRYPRVPFRFRLLERHLAVSQAFVPLGARPSILVVAPPGGAAPVPGGIRAFLLPGSMGVVLWRGTWHALTRFPLDPGGAAFLMVTGAATQAELEREQADGTRPRLTDTHDLEHELQIGDPDRLLPPGALDSAPA